MLHSPVSISQIISALRSISNGLIAQHTSQDECHLRHLLLDAAQIKLETAGKSNSRLTSSTSSQSVETGGHVSFIS
jgi:hypothetical protein